MVTYREQIDVVKSIRIAEGDKKTMDCPFCGGRSKFTIDRYDGKLVWNCFRASCNARGSFTGRRNEAAVKAFLSGNATQKKNYRINLIPKITTAPDNHSPAMEYLESVNSLEAYLRGDIRVRYAPSEDRVLFYTSDATGAVGRSLGRSKYKWWNYGDLTGGIHVGTGDHAVLVEDAPSACSVARIEGLVGVALLGTNITRGIKMTLSKYTVKTLVLDNDARAKAVCLNKRHSCVTRVRFTKKDLKHLTEGAIQCLLE